MEPCKTCRAWCAPDESGPTPYAGNCHYNPPVVAGANPWPITLATDWCLGHVAKRLGDVGYGGPYPVGSVPGGVPQ